MDLGVDGTTPEFVAPACHLVADPNRRGWPDASDERVIFADDDLRIGLAPCSCGHLYLLVWRRVRGSYFDYLVPVEEVELPGIEAYIARAPRNYTDKWAAAEQVVESLASSRPIIEYDGSALREPRWCAPAVPIAFTMPPF